MKDARDTAGLGYKSTIYEQPETGTGSMYPARLNGINDTPQKQEREPNTTSLERSPKPSPLLYNGKSRKHVSRKLRKFVLVYI